MFEALKRIIQGKPVFDTTSQEMPGIHQESSQDEHHFTIEKYNESTFPVVHIEHTHAHSHGHHMEVRCTIDNRWGDEVILDKIQLLGTTQRLGSSIGAHQAREVVVYSGPTFDRQPNSQAILDYKTKTGDYFQATHEVRFRFTSEKTYEVTDIAFRPPIRDIFG